jgi:hypothetical protein
VERQGGVIEDRVKRADQTREKDEEKRAVPCRFECGINAQHHGHVSRYLAQPTSVIQSLVKSHFGRLVAYHAR